MKQQWCLHRVALTRRDGQRRWDQVYQRLLDWTRPGPTEQQEDQEDQASAHEEGAREGSIVRARLDRTASPGTQ